jgi:eukaryotic-like serine/threonine-protein kinase
MVRISPESIPKALLIPGYENVPQLPLPDFWIDQFEVTNRQFKAFVDQGGYTKREHWKLDFKQDGKSLSWDAAMAHFRDAAGQPGPKNWLQGLCSARIQWMT